MTMLAAALDYAARGWPVFPCRPDKKPYPPHGFKEATTDEATIREWWRKHPRAMIGLPTGEASGLVVIDIDMKHPFEADEIDGEKSWNALLVKHRAAPPITREVDTPSGGRHLCFRYPGNAEIRNSAGKLGDGIDVRGDGGYVIAPPSEGAAGQYKLFRGIEPIDLPEWLLDELSRKPEPQRQERKPNGQDDDRWRAYGEAALRDACRKIATAPESRRNETLNAEAFPVFQLVAGGVLGERMARGALLDAALSCGLPEDEALRTIESAAQAGIAQPRQLPEGEWRSCDSNRNYGPRGNGPYSAYGADETDTPKTYEPLPFVKASDYAGKPVPETPWLDQRQIVARGHVTLLTGVGGIGKTIVMMQLLTGTVLEKSTWLGQPVNADGRRSALFYSAEEPEEVVHSRLAKICDYECIGFSDLTGLAIVYPQEETSLALFMQNARDGRVAATETYHRLVATIEAIKPVLFVIDNRGHVVSANENDRVVAHATMMALEQVARKYDMAVILLAHPSLTGINSGTGLSGSTGWANAARCHVNITRPSDDEPGPGDDGKRVLTVMKSNYGRVGETINVEWEMGCYRCTDQPERAGSGIGKADKAERVFMKLMRTYATRGMPVSPSENSSNYAPSRFFKEAEREGVNKREFEKAMNALIDRRQIVISKDSPGTRAKLILVIAGDEG